MTDPIVPVRLPDELKSRLDQAAPNNRSQFVREALREKLAKDLARAEGTHYDGRGRIVANPRAAIAELENESAGGS
jgi:metal-responsive CopG/Arc/MetJ family transcriptional regulator